MVVVLDYCVRGHHIYETPILGEALVCVPEFGNVHDPWQFASPVAAP